MTVNAVDAWWNLASTNHTIAITASDPSATLPTNAPLVSGTRAFSVTLKTAGSQTVTAADITDPSKTSATTSPLGINPGPVSRLVFTAQPAGATAGAAFATQPVVVSRDGYGNNSTNGLTATNFVTVALTSGTGPLQGTTAVNLGLSAGKGTAAFTGLRIDVAGTNDQLTVSSTNGLTQAVSSSFSVSPGAASKLGISVQPSATAVAGVAFATQPVIQVQDAFNNWRSGDTLVITATRNSGAGTLLGTTNITAVGGIATFTNLAHPYATNIALTFSSGSLTATNSGTISVSPGAMSRLQILAPGETAAPGTTTGKTGTANAQTAGTAFNVTVNAVDGWWNLVNTNHTIAITASDPNATLPTNAPLVGGTKAFSVTMKTAGGRMLTATDITDGSKAPVITPAIQVKPGAFARLQLLVPGETAIPGTVSGKSGSPSNQLVGVRFAVTVNGVDTNWNVINTNDTIRITSSDAAAVLPANAPLVGGTTNFNVTLMTPGTATLSASDVTHSGIVSNTSPALVVGAQGNTTNTINFTYTNRAALLADGWSYIARLPAGAGDRNTEITNAADGVLVSYDQTLHPGTLRIPSDAGDLWGTANNTRNSLFHGLSSNWVSLRLEVSYSPVLNVQQMQLGLYQDDDNYIEVGHAYNSNLGGELVSLVREDGGQYASSSPLSINHINLTASRLQLKLERDLVSDKVIASCSFDGTNWMIIGQTSQALTNAQVCIWTGGSPSGFPNCDLWRLETVTSSTPLNPILVAQPQHLVFNAVAGQPCTNLQQLRVVARRALASQVCGIASGAPWLTASVALTNTPASCDVAVNTAGLAAGKYEGILTLSAPGATSAVASVTLIVNPAVRAKVSTWRGAKSGAMTVWIDDSQPTAFDELSTNGFQGTYLLWGLTPIPSWVANYYQAGMEFGGHTVDHLCESLDDPTMRFEIETNIASIFAATPLTPNQLIGFAFPCGSASISSRIIASDYYLAVHGYNINLLEDPSPYDFTFLKAFNSHEHSPYPPADFKVLVDAAIAQGKWYNMVLHTTNDSDGAISYAAGKDIWVATGGALSKYILQRDRTFITNYQETAGQIRFSFSRLALDASSVRSFETAVSAQDLLTFQVDITGTNAAYSLTLDGVASPCSFKSAGGRSLVVFDAQVTTNARTALLQVFTNRPPALPVQPDLTVSQYSAVTVTNTAADPDAPPQVLSYTLLNPPLGAQIDGQGLIHWTPGAVPGLGTYTLTTVVSDNAQPPLSATNSINVRVAAQNWLQLPAVSNMTVVAGQSLLLTNTAIYTRPLNPWVTNSILFTYTNRDALMADGWNFLANTPGIGQRNTEIINPGVGAVISYDQTAHPGTLRIPCDLGDLWGNNNSSRNALFRDLPTNWSSLRLSLAFAPSLEFQQVHLCYYQDDDNYLQSGFAFNNGLGGQCATLILETNATPVHFFNGLYAATNIDLRLDMAPSGTSLTGWYSLDHTNWMILGTYPQVLSNPRLGIWVGGSPYSWTNELPVVDLRQLTTITTNPVVNLLHYTLLNSPPGATIDTNGVIAWTPAGSAGPSTNLFTTVVTDSGQPPISVTNSFLAIVRGWLTVTANDQTRFYGTTNPVFTGTISGAQAGDNITASFATSANAVSRVGTYSIVPVLNDPNQKLTNYVVLATNGTLTVTAAPLTATADNQSRPYGGTNPVWTVSYSGFVNGENASVVSGTLVGGTSAQAGSPVGNYPITVSGLAASNYSLQFRPGTLTVTPVALWVAARDATRAYSQTNPAFSAAFSGFVNGEETNVLTGSLVLSTPAQTNSPVGSYPIVPAGLLATNYTLLYSNGTLKVTPNALVVKADDHARRYGATNGLLTGTMSGLAPGDRITAAYSTPAATNSPVGNYAIVPSLSDPDSKLTNYSVTLSNGTLTVTQASLVATADNRSKRYGDANPTLTGGLVGLTSGDNITVGFLTAASTNSGVGSYPIDIVLSDPQGRLSNYAVTTNRGSLTVNPAPLTVTADNQTRPYGLTNPVRTVSYSGFVNGENASVITGTLIGGTSAQAGSPVGNYPIAVLGLAAPNYSLQYVPGTLTITPSPLIVAAQDAARAYGQANPPFSAAFRGFVNGENTNALTGSLVLYTLAQTNSPVGLYSIVPTGLTATNYTLLYSNGTLRVTANALVVKADDQTRRYGATNRVLTGTMTGLAPGDRITAAYSTSADTNSPSGNYPIVPSLSDPDSKLTNYSVTVSNGTLTVTQAPLVATADNQSKPYGAVNPALTGSLVGLVNADNISASFLTAATATNGVGSYPIVIQLSDPLARLSNYALTTNNGSLTVNPALLTVTADNQIRPYGGTNQPLTASISGFVMGETMAVVAGSPSLATAAAQGSGVGTYAILAGLGTLNAINYSFQMVDGTLTVT